MRILTLLLALLCSPAWAQTGPARVVDADTLHFASGYVRLWGMDGPESAQTCIRDGRPWPCGREATAALAALIAGRPVECEPRDTDRRGRIVRIVALCRVAGVDLSAAMVESGMAIAYRRFSLDYVAHEDRARVQRRGMWSGTFTAPEDWRRGSGR